MASDRNSESAWSSPGRARRLFRHWRVRELGSQRPQKLRGALAALEGDFDICEYRGVQNNVRMYSQYGRHPYCRLSREWCDKHFVRSGLPRTSQKGLKNISDGLTTDRARAF